MKNSFSTPIYFLIFFMSVYSASAQDKTPFETKKIINLNGDSEVKEILLPITDSIISATTLISSNIHVGELTVEIYDPLGEKHGNFSIGSQLKTKTIKNKNQAIKTDDSENNEKATGNLFRTLENPMKGDWKIKITSKNAKGIVNINYSTFKSTGKLYFKQK